MASIGVAGDAQNLFLAACSICPDVWRMQSENRIKGPLAEQDAWVDLVACILGSRVRHEVATRAVGSLVQEGLLDLSWLADAGPNALLAIEAGLKRIPSATGEPSSYPWPKLRAAQIVTSYHRLYTAANGLMSTILGAGTGRVARQELVNRACGIGPKQASLFLRNTRCAEDLAILDIHVLRYMAVVGLLSNSNPPRTMSQYEMVEKLLRTHAEDAGYSLGCFDLAIWVVMRSVGPQVPETACAS